MRWSRAERTEAKYQDLEHALRDFERAARAWAGTAMDDFSPLADQLLSYLQDKGLPLQEQRDAKGRGPIGVTASFNIGEELPAVGFRSGGRPIGPLGAFYSPEKGFRCAVVWPIDRFSFLVQPPPSASASAMVWRDNGK